MNEKVKNNIIIAIILFINILFAYKYISRYTNYVVLAIIPLVIFYFFVLKGLRLNLQKKTFLILTLIILAGFIAFSLFILDKIPVETLKVDRWSIIDKFWDFAFQNQYPYYAKSFDGNPPGPMPVYFVLALPFYFIGELGYIPIIGLLLFVAIIYKNKISCNKLFDITIILFSSIFSFWEIVSRSNIFFNSVLILAVLINFIKLDKNNRSRIYLNAVVAGLLLSTRSFLIIPYLVFFLGIIKRKEMRFKEIFNYGIISILAFIFSFLPLIIFFHEDFFKMNPFYVQSTFFIPSIYILGFIILAILLSYFSKTKHDSIFLGGIAMFVSILTYFIYCISKYGFENAYINSQADISYFIFCVPFLLYYYYIEQPNNNNTNPNTLKSSI